VVGHSDGPFIKTTMAAKLDGRRGRRSAVLVDFFGDSAFNRKIPKRSSPSTSEISGGIYHSLDGGNTSAHRIDVGLPESEICGQYRLTRSTRTRALRGFI